MNKKSSKNVFILHSRTEPVQFRLYQGISSLLNKALMSVWDYDDWDWMAYSGTKEDIIYSRSGLEIDPLRYMLHDPMPFVERPPAHQVDIGTLRRILKNSTVLVRMCVDGKSDSPGVKAETLELARQFRNDEKFYKHNN